MHRSRDIILKNILNSLQRNIILVIIDAANFRFNYVIDEAETHPNSESDSFDFHRRLSESVTGFTMLHTTPDKVFDIIRSLIPKHCCVSLHCRVAK